MKRKIVMVVVMVLALTSFGLAEEEQISIDFQRVPLRTVLRVLSGRTGKKLITDAELAGKEIVLSLEDVTPNEALNALLDTYELYYIRQPETNIYVIKSRQEEILVKVSRVFTLNHANAEEMIPIIEAQLNMGGQVRPDNRSNSVIVTDLADNLEKIGELIEKLDTPTPQVFIEAKILEFNLNDALQMGMDLTDFKKGPAPDVVYNQRFAPGVGGPKIAVGLIEDGYNIDALIEALQEKTEARMLNNPKVLVLSKETASINIVDEIPYTERTETSDGGVMTSISFKEVGVSIDVTPYVNKDGKINMEVNPSHSFETGRYGGDDIPVVKTSEVNTSFTLNDGETVVIGGLIRESESKSENKVPILGDIPILGYLFKSTHNRRENSELTVFITARVAKEPIANE